MRRFFISALTLCMLAVPSLLSAQAQRSPEFKNKYKLKEAVILSRHNIRSPLSDHKSTLGRMTTKDWNNWSAGKSELTLKGGALEALMGQYFRKWAVDAGLFPENYVPNADDVTVVANSMQRCIATANYFISGFMPVGDVKVNHRYAASKMDPLFNPQLTKVSDEFRKQALKQIAAMGGSKGMRGINEALTPDYQFMMEVLDYANSPVAKANGDEAKGLTNYDTEVILEAYQEPHFKKGSALPGMNAASDAFILQYYEEPDSVKAGFGKNLTREQWSRLAHIKDVYQDVLFTSPMVAINVARPLVQFMGDELRSDARKFVFLVGHDSNLSSLATAIGVKEYELPNSIEKKTPIGSKIVIEKFVGPDGKEYGDISIVYQNIDQLRNNEPLDLNNPPEVYQLTLSGIDRNADGLYAMSDILKRFDDTLRAYDALP